MLPIVRPYEYLIIQNLLEQAGKISLSALESKLNKTVTNWKPAGFSHALHYMMASGFFRKNGDELSFDNIRRDIIFEGYMQDLLDYGLGKYDVDYYDADPEETFHLWSKYRKEQVQQLLLNNPKDIMLGTKIYEGIVYAYVTVIKSNSTNDSLKYADGYIDANTFQWETVANVSEKELNNLKNSKKMHIFVRKVENEDGIQLPFTYIGSGKMQYQENSRKANGAHLFRVSMEKTAPEDIYFDFKLP